MKDDLFSGRLWSPGAKEKREPARAPEPHEQRPGADKVVPLRPDRTYVAYEVGSNPSGLHIRTASQGSFYPRYRYLADIRADHDHASYFVVIYPTMVVKVTGQQLAAVVHAIDAEQCERIYEFHPKLHDRPEPGAPIIEKIEIVCREVDSLFSEADSA